MASANLQFGPYQTEKILGRGGMGVVYAAVDSASGRRVAVKVLTHSMASDLRLRERFASEIETLQMLKHPRIVELVGYGEQEGQLFYAMELVAGRSLQEEVLGGRRFTWREAAKIGIDTCDALRLAHDHGVVHRDLKPANLLLDAEGRVKLSDFGIAKTFGGSQLTADGGVLGTADFMSPEQAEGRPATPKSDLYSLGSVLYAVLSRKAPFESKTLPEVIRRLIHEEPQPLSRLVPDLPDEFDDLVSVLLRKDPAQRIPTALAVGKRLQALLEEQPELEPLADDEYALEELPPDPRRATTPDTERGIRPTMALQSETSPQSQRRGAAAPEIAVHLKPTVVRPESEFERSDESLPKLEPVQPATRYTTVDRATTARPSSADHGDHDRYFVLKVSLMALVVALLVAGAAYIFWPPSADTLYGQIAAVAEGGQPDQLSQVEGEIDSFLSRFSGDSRAAEVADWKEEIERRRLRKRFERQTRRLGPASAESPVEKLYLSALDEARHSPEQAVAKLSALVDLFGGDENAPDSNRRCVELAEQEIEKLRGEIEQSHQEQSALLEAQLDRADKLAASDRKAAEGIWRGAIALYSEQPWAVEFVARARRNLGDTDTP